MLLIKTNPFIYIYNYNYIITPESQNELYSLDQGLAYLSDICIHI